MTFFLPVSVSVCNKKSSKMDLQRAVIVLRFEILLFSIQDLLKEYGREQSSELLHLKLIWLLCSRAEDYFDANTYEYDISAD